MGVATTSHAHGEPMILDPGPSSQGSLLPQKPVTNANGINVKRRRESEDSESPLLLPPPPMIAAAGPSGLPARPNLGFEVDQRGGTSSSNSNAVASSSSSGAGAGAGAAHPQASQAPPPHPQPQQPSSSSNCAHCSAPNPKYTCPRCHARSCSLPCSKAHKAATGCSGERNKAAYIGLNEYGWGSMMSDYSFLEDVGRKVGEWGKEIVKGGYGVGVGEGGVDAGRGTGRGMRGAVGMRGRGRGRGGGSGAGGGGKTKRDIFKMQMDVRDVDVEFLPVGMVRRKINQSGWDFKKQTGLLTIEFKFHKPRDPLAPSSKPADPPLTVITHRNAMNKSLLSILQALVKERCQASKSKKATTAPTSDNTAKSTSCPEWLTSLVIPSTEDPEGFTHPHCVMSAPVDPLRVAYTSGFKFKKAYYRLDVEQPLITALKNTGFVEFPTIEVWEEFGGGVIVDPQGRVSLQPEQEDGEGEGPRVKRRRLGKKAGKERICGLVGGYGSGDESEGEVQEEKEKEVKRNVMSLLGEYSEGEDSDAEGGSDEGDKEAAADADGVLGEAGAAGGDEEDEEQELEPAALMELLQKIKGEQWKVPDTYNGDEDVLEWGDLSDADAEGEDDPGEYEEIGE